MNDVFSASQTLGWSTTPQARARARAVATVIALVTAVGTLLRDDLEHPDGPLFVLGLVGITGSVLALLARRRFPFAAPATESTRYRMGK